MSVYLRKSAYLCKQNSNSKENEKKYCALPADGRNACLRIVPEVERYRNDVL